MLDKLLLISCVCIVVALLLYFFHWNRFIGFLIGLGIRIMYWKGEASSIWVEVGSIHFSILSGRILFKDFSYHSSNQTVRIVKGQVQWRYWIRRSTSENDIGYLRGGEDPLSSRALQCRIQISIQGIEWFIYNRTAAFDNIISQMQPKSSSRPASRSTERRQSFQQASCQASFTPSYPPSALKSLRMPHGIQRIVTWIKRQLPSLDPKDLLPVGMEIAKGAITCGNNSTPNLLIAEFQRSEGTFGLVESKSKLDLHKQLLSMRFQQVIFRYADNENYTDIMTSMGALVHDHITKHSTLDRPSSYLPYRSFMTLWRRIRPLNFPKKYNSDRVMVKQGFLKTQKNKQDQSTPTGADFEYAIERKILETPLFELSYFFDVTGEVPEPSGCHENVGVESIDIGNGDVAPDWGFNIIIHGGVLRYGPWADRQRTELQRVFFPPTYHDTEVTPSLKPGDKRLWTAIRVFVELRDNTVLQIPFREPSKDWQWDGQSGMPQNSRVREATAIHVTVGDRSSISYSLPMVTGPAGYRPVLEVHLDTVVITSSLNDIQMVTSESCRVHCEMPTPLKWNEERKWLTTLTLRQPVLYLIRDHINMFIDLGKDWTTGPPSDYQRFIPMIYVFEVAFDHYELNVYVNDHNIIDKPLLRDENALLTLRGTRFILTTDILLNEFRPECTTIPFTIDVPDSSLSLSLPRWNINALHAPRGGNSLANIRCLRVSGSYQYFAETCPNYVEQLKLNFDLRDVAFKNLGWSIRYFMVFRENYLGSFTHFVTLYEYLDRRKKNQPLGDPVSSKYRPGKNNILQIEIQVFIHGGIVIMPVGLPGYSSIRDKDRGIGDCLILTLPILQLQFRMHDHYMEMSLNVSSVSGGLIHNYPEKVTYKKEALEGLKDILHIDGLDIIANRLFGPQPRTATYVCIWEVSFGPTKVLLSASGARLLAAAGTAFRLNFVDALNAPAYEYLPPVDPDVSFVKFSIKSFDMTWRAGQAALVFNLPWGIKMNTNDLGGRFHRKLTSLKVPDIHVKLLLTSQSHGSYWFEAANFSADAYADVYTAPRGYRKMARIQTSYIEEQDHLTRRARRMFASLGPQNAEYLKTTPHKNGLYLPHPTLPEQHHVGASVNFTRVNYTRRPRSSVARLSDSDTEEGISEADRDARLAKTRSSTPIPRSIYEDDQNISSGDESDDEDLTDTSSDSDWSEFSDAVDSEFDSEREALRHYSHVIRHYTTRILESPNLWDGCPFVLVRDCPQLSSVMSQLPGEPEGYEKSSPPRVCSEDQSNTYLRFKGKKLLSVKVTPLALQGLVHFEEDVRNNPLSPELCLDAMMANYLSQMSLSPETTSCLFFEASVPVVAVQALQRIVMMDGHSTISHNPTRADDSAMSDGIAVLQATCGGLSTSGSVIKNSFSLEVGFRHSSVTLGMSFDKKTVYTVSPDKFIFGFDFRNTKFSLSEQSLVIDWEESSFDIGHLGPEYVLATGLALSHTARQLIELHQRWKKDSSLLKRCVVSDIIRCSGDTATVDPLSTIQPSYLVQSGLPQMLRTDTTFRFLHHLRNCLWHLEAVELDKLWLAQDVTQRGDLATLLPLLEARLAALDPDYYNVTQLPLESLLPILEIDNPSMAPPDIGYLYNSISLRFAKLTFKVLDPANRSPSELILADVDVKARAFKGDIVQLPSMDLTSLSQTSLREKRPQNVLKSSVLVHFGNLTLTVSPHLMGFAQRLLRVQRQSLSPTNEAKPASSNSHANVRFVSVEVLFSLDHFCVQAAAENLVFEFGLSRIRGVSSILLRPPTLSRQSMSHSVLFDQVFIRARSPSDAGKQSDQDILASLELANGKISTIIRRESALKPKLHLGFTLGNIQLLVPRSALRLYRFVQEWRADFLPGLEATMQALLSEIHKAPSKPKSPQMQRVSSGRPSFSVQGELSHIGIALQVMHGTWLSWEAHDLTAYTNSANTPTPSYSFGLQIASVILSISSRPNVPDEEPGTRVEIILPPLLSKGNYDGSGVETIVLIEFAELKVKPSYWDTLLVVQQKFGQDFHDLVNLILETDVRRETLDNSKTLRRSQAPLRYNVSVKMRGFRVGFESPASTVYFECLDISGGVNNSDGLMCNVELSDMAFSLASRAFSRHDNPGFNRDHRSAFVIVDFKIHARNESTSTDSSTVIQVLVSKIHAVMQPSSIGEVGDFVDHIQAELLKRKEQRALELAAFKEKTRRILQTFEVGAHDTLADTRPWLDRYIINVSTQNIGVAFPLTHDVDIQLPRTGSRDSTSVPAFLWSIKSIEFGTHRGQTGQAEMKLFSFQFISSFRQSVPEDFSGENHLTRNKLVYPQMKAQLRSTGPLTTSSHTFVKADVSGFILDLDSSITSFVFSLIDVYRQGKNRMEKISNSLPRIPPTGDPNILEKELQAEKTRSTLPTSNLFASMTFRSGKVRVYSEAASKLFQDKAKTSPKNDQELSDQQVMEMGAEVFNLPVVSVWTEYHAAPTFQSLFSPSEPILMFKSTVHSSQNTLRPTLLPFLTELVKHVETRLRRISLQSSQPAQTVSEDQMATTPEQNRIDSRTSLRINFSLRIDQSKLELTCQPDVNVIAGLHWDSGGFVISVSPGARKITFTGSVGGLTLGLKHGFLSEDCVRLDARNLSFSVAFAKVGGDRGVIGSSFSIILDTEFLGVVRFSRLQDILCFKAVWLDRIPVFNNPPSAVSAKASIGPSTSAQHLTQVPKQPFTTIMLIRIRRITVDVDFGQSISAITLDLRDATMRTKLTQVRSELSVFVDDLNMIAKGNVAGNAHVPKCVFQTIRSIEGSSDAQEGRNQMLELNMTSGPLVVSLESDHQKLLHYRAEPLEIKIFDDWSMPVAQPNAETKPLRLSFTVKSPDIVAVATVGTIPKLLAYVNKFKANLDAQRRGASRESKAFRVTRTPKPDNPLSAVAEAILVSARSRFKEAENDLIYVIMQHMSLELESLRLVVFPRTMGDLEIVHFLGRDVKAQLNRLVESAPVVGKRDLLLSFSSMNISKFTGLGHPQTYELSDGRKWLASLLHGASEATIVGLPSMTMHMVSEEKVEDTVTTLVYDFHSRFVRQGNSREYHDIYITLNVALYSWLTVLRKNLTREMEQVKASTDWRVLLNATSAQVGGVKKKGLEPLSLRSTTEPSPLKRPFSPATTALRGDSTELLLSAASSTLSTPRSSSPGLQSFPLIQSRAARPAKQAGIVYKPRSRHIERLTMRQLGEATPDVMHPFFMKKAGFNLEDSLPQYVNEYATTPLEEIMEVLLKLYSRQLLSNSK